MDIRMQREGDTATFFPVGEMIADASGLAREAMMQQIELGKGLKAVVVDLRATTLVDSTGVGVLMGLRLHLQSRRIAFRVANPVGPVLQTIEAMGLKGIFGLEPANG